MLWLARHCQNTRPIESLSPAVTYRNPWMHTRRNSVSCAIMRLMDPQAACTAAFLYSVVQTNSELCQVEISADLYLFSLGQAPPPRRTGPRCTGDGYGDSRSEVRQLVVSPTRPVADPGIGKQKNPRIVARLICQNHQSICHERYLYVSVFLW